MKNLVCVLLTVPALVLACGGEKAAPVVDETPADPAPVSDVVDAATPVEFEAICGHALPDVGKCGNFIKVEGEWVVLEHPSLGGMEWCGAGETGATVKVAGARTDGKFVASTYELVE